jgi:protoporphyrinogen oxidase
MKVNNLIIGGGISGLTLANYITDYLIVEKDSSLGGYARTHYVDDYIWDYAGHFFHFKTDEFKSMFINSMDKNDYIIKNKNTYIYFEDKLIDYPFQMNIHELSKDKFIDCLYDLFNKQEKEVYNNFLDMLYGKFGISITEMFLKPYNEKLYATDLTKLDKDAMGRFFPYANITEIINNMKNHSNTSYNNTFMYPKKGAQVIVNKLCEKVDMNKVMLNTSVTSIDLNKKEVTLSTKEVISYNNLINTIPFNKFLSLLNIQEYTNFSNELSYNKVLVFNLGFDKKSTYNNTDWIYFPDKNINFYRAGFYDNILSTDKLSMYIEIGYSKESIIDESTINKELSLTLDNLKKCKIIDDTFKLVKYESIIMDPAYVHIDTLHDKLVKEIINDLETKNVYSVGRYGSWTYSSMEDAMLQSKELVEKL